MPENVFQGFGNLVPQWPLPGLPLALAVWIVLALDARRSISRQVGELPFIGLLTSDFPLHDKHII